MGAIAYTCGYPMFTLDKGTDIIGIVSVCHSEETAKTHHRTQ